MIDLRERSSPDLAFAHSVNDTSPIHQVIAAERLHAFKCHTISGSKAAWNDIVFETRCLIPLEERHVYKKVEARQCRASRKHRAYLNDELDWSLVHMRGTQIEHGHAESSEVVRWVMTRGDRM
jgi:hypothetical protein